MISLKKGSLAVLAFAVIVSSEAAAQARPATRTTRAQASTDQGYWELGTDASLSIGLGDPKTLTISIPTGILRAGYFVTPALSLEPQFIFNSFAQENDVAQSAWALQIGGLYHLSTDRRQSQLFIHPGIAFTGGSGGSPNFTILSAGFGMKKPILNNRLALRGEVGLAHQLKEGVFDSQTSVFTTFGWSVYTR